MDDFESYIDKAGNRIYDTWVDGLGGNGTGSQVGYWQAPFAEQTIVHGGKQSMPFEYNNVKAPYYSEATRTFDTAAGLDRRRRQHAVAVLPGLSRWRFVDKGNNAYTVASTGTDIWNNSDQFRFVYKTLSGNGSITARVDGLTRSDAWSKAGVMIRESLDAGSRHASIVLTPDNSCSQQYRATTGGAAASTDWTGTAVQAPYWVRVTRTGNTFKTETSADGKTWKAQGPDQTINMVANVYIGLCVTSHNAAAYSVADFSNVTTTRHGRLAEPVHRRDAVEQRCGPAVSDGRRQGRQEEDGRQPRCVRREQDRVDAVEDRPERPDGRQPGRREEAHARRRRQRQPDTGCRRHAVHRRHHVRQACRARESGRQRRLRNGCHRALERLRQRRRPP